MPSADVVHGLIELFEAGASAPARWAAGLSREQLLATPVAGAWSMQTLIVHMLDSDIAATHRMRRVAAEELPLLIAYDETLAAQNLAYDKMDIKQVCDLFALNRAFTAAWLRTLAPQTFDRAGVHNHRGRVTLVEFVQLYVNHVTHHEKFAMAKRRAMGL